jgi:hypothetical protein
MSKILLPHQGQKILKGIQIQDETQPNFLLGQGWVGSNPKIYCPNPSLFWDILG